MNKISPNDHENSHTKVIVHWDANVKKDMHFNKKCIMIITTVMFFIGGCIVVSDAMFSMYYIRNPYIYTYTLRVYKNPFNKSNTTIGYNEKNATLLSFTANLTDFQDKWYNGNVTDEEIAAYVMTHIIDGANSYRLFVTTLVFGFLQILASIFAFNIRSPHYNWKKDMITLIIYESLGNTASIANIVIWFYIEFGESFNYFLYLPIHIMLHDSALFFTVCNGALKLYLFSFTFNDYFAALPVFKPKEKKKKY